MNDLRDVARGASGKTTYASLTVRAKSPSQVEKIESAIREMGFSTFSLLDASRNLRLFFTIFDSLLAIFGSLALAVATLGIINTLVMAILERRREIGVLKALGAADRDVQQLIFRGSRRDGIVGWNFGRRLGLGDWTCHEFRHERVSSQRQDLPPITVSSVPWWMVCGGDRILGGREPGGGTLSGVARGAAESSRGPAV